MKIVFKILGGLLLFFVLAGVIFYLMYNEEIPPTVQNADAEVLTEKMMTAVNKAAWDSTRWVKWDFAGRNQYVWNKERNLVKVIMGSDVVLLDPSNVTGKAFQDDNLVAGDEAQVLVTAAWNNFNNDSFWLNAIAKAKDPGTLRSVVDLGNGQQGLKVEYSSGGSTPGDVYVWALDENYLPNSYRMWAEIIPIGGAWATWENYESISTGALISRKHKILSGPELELTDVAGGMSLSDVGLSEDPFAGM